MLADAAGVERLAALGVTDAIAVPWNLLGPEIPLEEGLSETVEWYKANYLGHAAYY